MKKLMLVCNSGGHLSEMLEYDEIFNDFDYSLITEETEITSKLVNKYNIKFVKYMTRSNMLKYLVNGMFNVFTAIVDILKYKPDVIVSTGACIGAIYCFIGKIFGKKIIYIESLARVNTLSGTGKVVYKFADKFYVQWESLALKYTKAEYIGE